MVKVPINVNEFYGDDLVYLDFPESWNVQVVKMKGYDAPPFTDSQITDALEHPIGTPTIGELAKGKTGRIVVTCDDLTRPTPAYRVFPFIMKELNKAGVADDKIFILGSFGCHHPMNLDAFARKVGWEMIQKYDVVNHNPFEHFQDLGKTSRGTDLQINTEFMKTDLRICVSGIKRHELYGCGGGGKAIVPGVSSLNTIVWNHHLIRSEGARGGPWKIRDSPWRADMQEAARMAKLDVTVNLNYNGKRELVGLHVGDVDEAWHQAVKMGYELHSHTVPKEEADIVIVNAYPQADQGIDWSGANASLREGGTAVAVHQLITGTALLHYRPEHMGQYWERINGYPNRRWPVKKAANIIVFTMKLSRRDMNSYSPKVEWKTSWGEIIARLRELHPDGAKVHVYPCGKLQFDPNMLPLAL